ncbi:MAG: outer membrane beta-barrel protein, partial [Ketobacteraceae bacterium]|nr:outer membrane beta-barrel protein [Ketobacteraceae bacterium]
YLGNQASGNVAFDIAYTDFGTAEDKLYNEVELNISSFGAGLLMGAQPSEDARVFVTVGLHAWDGEVTSRFLPYHEEDSGSDMYYGFGGSFDIATGLAVGARYTKYDINDEDISLATVNLEARF